MLEMGTLLQARQGLGLDVAGGCAWCCRALDTFP